MKRILLIMLSVSFLGSCIKKPGCTDNDALNYNYDANQDDGSCNYSEVTFYARYGYYNNIPINQVDVSINGNEIGSIRAVYPNGPGNCSASGTISYEFQDGETADWNSTVFLANGATLFGSGTVSPNSLECIKVNVTK